MKQPKIIQKIPREKKIILMESDNNRAAFRYTIIYLSDGKKLLSGYNLKFYEERIDNTQEQVWHTFLDSFDNQNT